MRSRLVLGNWKMHGSSEMLQRELPVLAASNTAAQLGVCVSALHVSKALELVSGALGIGVQDISDEPNPGAYTGEISATMAAEMGAQYAIVGHSERRARHAESNASVGKKALAASAAGLIAVACVGETLSDREAGQTLSVVGSQLQAILQAYEYAPENLVIAYEPVWAIGTGRTATVDDAAAVHQALRAQLAENFDLAWANQCQIIYGGSVNAANAAALFSSPDIDGGLVGGASLAATSLLAIANA